MKVLVAGGTGFIGSYLCRALADDGHAVTALSRSPEEAPEGVTGVTGDVTDYDSIASAVDGHDAVVMGERAPSFRSFVFGEESERVAAASVGPVLVVRDRRADDESDGGAAASAADDTAPAADE
ncbi:hypothetical protein DJ72_10255 [Halorubrum distributum]|nr:hypothetical protein DJ72_10255 [Halorubrum distributum]